MMFWPMIKPVAVEMTIFPPEPPLVRALEMLSTVPGFQMIDPPVHVRLLGMDVVALRVRLPDWSVTEPVPSAEALPEMRVPAKIEVPPE